MFLSCVSLCHSDVFHLGDMTDGLCAVLASPDVSRRLQVFPDNLVPLMAARGVEMILGILGILRTGSGPSMFKRFTTKSTVVWGEEQKGIATRSTRSYCTSNNLISRPFGQIEAMGGLKEKEKRLFQTRVVKWYAEGSSFVSDTRYASRFVW